MRLDDEQMAIIEKADQLTKCYSSTIEETHWLNEEEAYSLIESFVEIMDTPTNWRISELYKKLDAQDKIINEQALEIARLKVKLDKVNKKINQYEIITGYYDCNYDGVEDTYSRDIKDDLLEILGDKENENIN